MTIAQQRHDEHVRDLLTAARVMRMMDPRDQDALAYQHAAHGCDFEDSEVQCPVCTENPLEIFV